MIVVLLAMAFLALNANVQKARRAQIENVTIIRVSPTVTPAVSITR